MKPVLIYVMAILFSVIAWISWTSKTPITDAQPFVFAFWIALILYLIERSINGRFDR